MKEGLEKFYFKSERREKKKRRKMKVSGKRIFQLLEIIKKKG